MACRCFTPLFLLLCALPSALCVLFNVSIDDTFGDERNGNLISYTPDDVWEVGQSCTGCTAVINANQTYKQSWHDATFSPVDIGGDGVIRSASVSFNGTAVYVLCILTRSLTSPDGNTDMTFFIDNVQVDPVFEQLPNGNKTYLYDQIVFSHAGLPFGLHNVRIDVGHNGTKALILLDRIIYTTVISDSASTSSLLPKLTITDVISTPTITTSSGLTNSLSRLFFVFAPLFSAGAVYWF